MTSPTTVVYSQNYVSTACGQLESLLKQHFPGCLIADHKGNEHIFYDWQYIYRVMYTFKTRYKWDITIGSLVIDSKTLGFGKSFHNIAFSIFYIEEDRALFVSVYKPRE